MDDRCPNILLMTCHDLGRHLGCYGVDTVQSPQLDALAASGVRWERAFTTSPGCSPSRASLATGRYPHSNGVMGLAHPPYGWNLHPDERHIAQILSAAGYQTHLFGFQHVSTSLERLGFHSIHGSDRVYSCHQPALGRNVAELFADFMQARRWTGPLYMEINLEEPHRPYDQGGCMPDDARGVFVPGYLPEGPESREEMAALQGAIRQADHAVGHILAALDAVGLGEETLVIFLADHGIAMPRAKCTLYDAGIGIALLMRWPAGGLVGGRTMPEMVSIVDVLPTLLELADVPVPPPVQGRSLLPLLRLDPYEPRSEIFAEKTFHSYYDPMRAIRTERFKYIRNFETTFAVEVPADVQLGPIFRAHVERYHASEHPPTEFYDLDADPLELHNLAGSIELSEVERLLDVRLRDWMRETGDPLLEGPVASPGYRRAI